MLYRRLPATGEKISALGFGCMRFPRRGVSIDEARSERLLATAIDYGVNFYDAAYIYLGCEKALGKGLANLGARGRVKISTKLPIMFVKNKREIEEAFEKQLKRLNTEYIDFYLAHSLTSYADLARLIEKGYLDFIESERARGRILNTGFSFHGNTHDFRLIADAYPWEICMIQYNYLDEHYQAGIEGLEYAAAKGIGVVAMEPLKGGLLGSRMPRAAQRVFEQNCGQSDCKSPAELAMRWIWQHPSVTCLISGMGEERFIEDNCRTVFALGTAAAAAGSSPGSGGGDILMPVALSGAETKAVESIRKFFDVNLSVPCTSCAYCMPCPNGVDIPTCFYWYNIRKELFSNIHYIVATEGAVNNRPSKASLCTGCRACEKHCPQNIEISRHMKEAARKLEKAWLRVPVRMALKSMSNSKKTP